MDNSIDNFIITIEGNGVPFEIITCLKTVINKLESLAKIDGSGWGDETKWIHQNEDSYIECSIKNNE